LPERAQLVQGTW